MARVIDYISLILIVFFLTFVWSTVVFSSWIIALIFSAALALVCAVSAKYALSHCGRKYSYDRLALEFSVKGSEYVINLLKSILKNNQIESGSNYILLKDSIVIANFRFNILTINDMSTICALANKHSRKHVYVVARGIDRRAYQALQLENISLNIVKIRAMYKYLKKHDALPELKPVKNKFSLAALIETVFKRSNMKNYIFTGAVLILVAFLTPLKIYYLIFGSISLLFAMLTLTPIGSGTFRTSRLFDELDAIAAKNDDSQNKRDLPDSGEGLPEICDESKTDDRSDGTKFDGGSETKIIEPQDGRSHQDDASTDKTNPDGNSDNGNK